MKLAILLAAAALSGCGSSSQKPPPKPAVVPASTPAAAPAPEPESAGQKEVTDLANQNATVEAGVRALKDDVQSLDDSEDAVAARRAELQRLEVKRDELAASATSLRDRAKAVADKADEKAETIKAAQEERGRADRQLRALEDVKAKFTAIAERIAQAGDAKPDEPKPTAPKKPVKKKK